MAQSRKPCEFVIRNFSKLSTSLNSRISLKDMAKIVQVSLTDVSHRSERKFENSTKECGLNAEKNGTIPNDEFAVMEATKVLKGGGIIGIPTDTIYGIACLAQREDAVKKLYDIKGRDHNKPVAICVGRTQDIPKWAKVIVSHELLDILFPGPVTIVFERSSDLNSSLNPHTNLVGIRIPNSSFICRVAQSCGEPLALTSANVSSQASTLNVKEFAQLWPKLDVIFDGGKLGAYDPQRLGSTVVDLSVSGAFKITRPGCASEPTRDVLLKYKLCESVRLSSQELA